MHSLAKIEWGIVNLESNWENFTQSENFRKWREIWSCGEMHHCLRGVDAPVHCSGES